ncbi:MAG: phosphatidylglycerol lysyltransferase domain-containing protein [Cyanobacteria bacterium]|nr:phosphatidylglycerol lysyltransferase domain-containing protein [Cyanobacteriota bacterium]
MQLDHKNYLNTSVTDLLGLLGLKKNNVDKQKATGLVEKFGRWSLDYYKLWDDKSFYFAEGLNAFLAYSNFANISMVLGDPVGAIDDLAPLVNSFKNYCQEQNLKPCFFQTSPQLAETYQSLGFSNVKLGNESIIDVSSFNIASEKNKSLRAGLRLLDSLRYKVRYYKNPCSKEFLGELKQVSKAWLLNGEEEKSFALGSYDPDYIKSTTVMTVENFAGNVVAFVNLVSSGQPGELNIDLIRLSPELSSEILEFLFVHTILFFKELGYKRINLGMIPSLIVDTHDDQGALVLKTLMQKMSFLFVQPSLIDIKKSFADKLRPRYFYFL